MLKRKKPRKIIYGGTEITVGIPLSRRTFKKIKKQLREK